MNKILKFILLLFEKNIKINKFFNTYLFNKLNLIFNLILKVVDFRVTITFFT